MDLERRKPRSRLCLILWLAGCPAVAGDFEEARALFAARRYPEARAAFEKIIATEPRSAAACHYLGLTLRLHQEPAVVQEAVNWLARAVELEPDNATYLADFGGASLLQAGRTRSYLDATRGRDAMEKALRLEPGNLDAREGLIQFYERAPWPIGSSAKAAAHLAELRRRDSERATVLEVVARSNAKDYAAAFQLCRDVLARHPDHYAALYYLGRTASLSGQNLPRGLACLERCLTLDPPTPASPTHSNVWYRIGVIQEKLQHPAEAGRAYAAALKLDPSNRPAASARARLEAQAPPR